MGPVLTLACGDSRARTARYSKQRCRNPACDRCFWPGQRCGRDQVRELSQVQAGHFGGLRGSRSQRWLSGLGRRAPWDALGDLGSDSETLSYARLISEITRLER